ncbi:RagB/SusD family nutrient uptake outer membrane protein [Lacibacter sp.]|uniref:RagB/SusD family nutrient uptake outer membrane protein n=1 Tax=Lacibacter sp. TaxID=1915409 RepID=UPI002B4B408B|nr:RagB/SusD family nutrient uptake outer membrane protein [Lacibacter sp.]HLP37723.1 RagB/SusD family nutrient uptake outer membrane protein [Lacibacter sp.]
MKTIFFLVMTGLIFLTSCTKDFLDDKPDESRVVPNRFKDFQALLDNSQVMNTRHPSIGQLGADEFYITYDRWISYSITRYRNAYRWAQDMYEGDQRVIEWDYPYQQVFYANLVLDGIAEYGNTENNIWKELKGAALFYRSYGYYQLAQLFCKPYVKATAETDLGIPLRSGSDVTEPVVRSTVAATYHQMLTDFTEAVNLLPETQTSKLRPVKAAAHGMLARVYLLMGEFDQANLSAKAALALHSTLLDYNTLSSSASFPLSRFNAEVLFHSVMLSDASASRISIDSNLYASYAVTDKRRSAFFRVNTGRLIFRGSYDGSAIYFNGLATDELMLMAAECEARLGEKQAALDYLNQLLVKRYQTGSFVPLAAATAEEALQLVLQERRKELTFRGLRWSDLRRLNTQGSSITLTRNMNGEIVTLSPNSPLYVLPIPDIVIRLSGIAQNER